MKKIIIIGIAFLISSSAIAQMTTPPQPNTQLLVALLATIAILGPSQPSREGFIFY